MRILIAGDFAPTERIRTIIESGNGHRLLSDATDILNDVDYSFVNLEAPYCRTLDYPITKRGPHLNSPKGTIELIKQVGFNGVTLANNHINDYGTNGIKDTIEELDRLSVDYVGIGMNLRQAIEPITKNIGGQYVSFISICENEFSIATNSSAGAAPINPIQNYNQIKEAKKYSDYVIVITHGGHEHYQLPSPRMKELYRFFIDAGANAVVNHHQHCFSGFEYYNDCPIVYGLGNFCFDSSKRMNTIWNYGYMAILNLVGNKFLIETIPYEQALKDVGLKILYGDNRLSFDKKIEELNKIISDDNSLQSEYAKFIKRKRKAVLGVFSPYPSETIREIASRGWIPNLLSVGQVSTLLNYIMCESQRDVTIGVLNNILIKNDHIQKNIK